VALVGGGPGDPDLLTVEGAACSPAPTSSSATGWPPTCPCRTAWRSWRSARRPRGPSWSQRDIEALLVERAQQGRRVVRLKGGDVHVFARGIEEVAACVQAGVPVEVVPGISSALAGPTSAGIPVTARA
jgi:siroheme synthase